VSCLLIAVEIQPTSVIWLLIPLALLLTGESHCASLPILRQATFRAQLTLVLSLSPPLSSDSAIFRVPVKSVLFRRVRDALLEIEQAYYKISISTLQ
jgi:hypothetical protein